MKKSTKGHMRASDGKYHIHGKKYDMLIGSRAQVHHGTAYKTSGGLTKAKLIMNKHGRIVSAKASRSAKKNNHLKKAGWTAQKGKFGAVKIDDLKKSKKKSKGKKRR